ADGADGAGGATDGGAVSPDSRGRPATSEDAEGRATSSAVTASSDDGLAGALSRADRRAKMIALVAIPSTALDQMNNPRGRRRRVGELPSAPGSAAPARGGPSGMVGGSTSPRSPRGSVRVSWTLSSASPAPGSVTTMVGTGPMGGGADRRASLSV